MKDFHMDLFLYTDNFMLHKTRMLAQTHIKCICKVYGLRVR